MQETKSAGFAGQAPLVVAGEALIDLIQQPDGRLEPHLGGSPWNLARALGRLGCEVSYVNPLSADDFGTQLQAALVESRVRCMGGRSPLPTSLAVVKLDMLGHPSYAFYREGVADRDLNPEALLAAIPAGAALFHTGSLALMPPDGEAWKHLLCALIARGQATSIDINMRPKVARDLSAYAALALEVLACGRCVKVSDEDLQALGRTGQPLDEARQLLGEVTKVVVLTCGARGAWCLTQEGVCHQTPAQLTVVDTVGAGDCFYAGFLAHLVVRGRLGHAGEPAPALLHLAEAMAFGNRVTAHNLQRAGCQPPWLHELHAQLAAYPFPVAHQGTLPSPASR